MRLTTGMILAASAMALAGCHSHGGYFEADPTLALGPGCPDCPSHARWPAYFGTPGVIPLSDEIVYANSPAYGPPPAPRVVRVEREAPPPPPPVILSPAPPMTGVLTPIPHRGYEPPPGPPPRSQPPMRTAPAYQPPPRTAPRSGSVDAPRLDQDFGVEPYAPPPRPGAPLPPPR